MEPWFLVLAGLNTNLRLKIKIRKISRFLKIVALRHVTTSLNLFHKLLAIIGTRCAKGNLIIHKDAVSEMPFAEPLSCSF